jgi:predicted AlkP superfamily phosphohydrolase/phosphomutase
MMNKRLEAVLFLKKTIPVDFLMIVFTSCDRIQHALWNKQKIIWDYWEELDKTLNNLLETFDRQTNVFILSDHGFGPLRKTFYVNEWLREQNYLLLKSKYIESFITTVGRIAEKIYRGIGNFKFLEPVLNYFKELIGLDIIQKVTYNYLSNERLNRRVAWKRTKAFAAVHSPHFGQIYLNIKGKMKRGCLTHEVRDEFRELLIKNLKKLNDPITGEKFNIEVFKPEEIYTGEYLKDAPDIVFIIENGEIEIDATVGDEKIFTDGSPFTGWTGTHTKTGIFIANGPEVRRGQKLEPSSILDVTPTILKIYGIPIPEEIDGKPLEKLYSRVFSEREKQDIREEKKYSNGLKDEEKLLIEDHLRRLGYIS